MGMEAEIGLLHQAAQRCCSHQDEQDQGSDAAASEFLDILFKPVRSINLGSMEAQSDCESLLSAAINLLDPSTAVGQVLVDQLGLELVRVTIQYMEISQKCCEKAETILKILAETGNPRDMFTAYMEALHLSWESQNIVPCISLLDSLPTIFTRIRARRPEFLRVALPGLIQVARLAVEAEIEILKVFDKLVQLATVILNLCLHEQVEKQRQRLHHMLGFFILLLLAIICNDQQLVRLDILPMVVQLSTLLPICSFSYFNLLTGTFLEDILEPIMEELNNSIVELLESRRGGVLAVYWGFHYDRVAAAAKENLETLKDKLNNSEHATLQAICNVKVLLSPQECSWQLVEKGIDVLLTILKMCNLPVHASNDVSSGNWNEMGSSFGSLLEVLEEVVIYSPDAELRQRAYTAFITVITKVLPARIRFDNLKALIIKCKHSSMISLLLGCVKEEAAKALTARQMVETGDDPGDSSPVEWPFASEELCSIIEFILHPPGGGPPDLPTQIDAVLGALNLYRYILIKETKGNSNYTGVASKLQLQRANLLWILPLGETLAGLHKNLGENSTESTVYMLLAIENVEGVRYRCLELVEEALRHCP